MGRKNDSSKFRVCPTMEAVKTEADMNKLLSLVCSEKIKNPSEVFYDGKENGAKEKRLKPTKAHLIKTLDYVCENPPKKNENAQREPLFYGDEATKKKTKEEALRLLNESYETYNSKDSWCIFEGFSQPDVFINSENHIIICEGKWTEQGITTHTTYLPKRNQMARHIQGAKNAYPKKKIIAFYIVDAECGYTNMLTKQAFSTQLDEETIPLSKEEKEELLSSFYGYTTWQEISKIFPSIVYKEKE